MKKILVRPSLLKKVDSSRLNLYKKTLVKFMDHHSHGAHLEKLRTDKPLYSIRANDTERLILTPVKHQNEQRWLLVAILPRHQYDVLSKKDGHWLKNQIHNTIEYDFPLVDDAEEEPNANEAPEFQEEHGIEFHQNHFILFDEHQKKAKSASYPLLITGAPGSGKSALSLSLIAQQITETPPTQPKRLMYLAQSESLVLHMQQEWKKLVEAQGLNTEGYEVLFKTPKQLFLEYNAGEENTPALVEQNEFCDWFKQYKINKNQQLKAKSHSKRASNPILERQLAFDPQKIYQEFRTLSAYTTYDEYNEAVGNKHTLFAQSEDRKWIWTVYEDYVNALKKEHKTDLTFQSIRSRVPVHFMAVDEAQDLSRKQLASLAECVVANDNAQHPIAYCIGDHQRVYDSRSIVPFIKSIFWKIYGKDIVSHHPLQASYRCPAEVLDLANAFLQIKYHITEEGSEKHSLRYVSTSEHLDEAGSIHWIENKEDLSPLIADKNNAHFAVITTLKHKEEAQKLFGIERVFTAEEIKGLEYKHILLYCPLAGTEYKDANDALHEEFQIQKHPEKEEGPKSTKSSIIHNIALNKLFVAATRAQISVSLYQPKDHTISKLRNVIKTFIHTDKKLTEHAQHTPTQSSEEEWKQRAALLAKANQTAQANAIHERLREQQEPVKNTVSKKAAAKIKQRNKLIEDFIEGLIEQKLNQIKSLLDHPKIKEYLFDTNLSEIHSNFSDTSLIQFLTKNTNHYAYFFHAFAASLIANEKLNKTEELERMIPIMFLRYDDHYHGNKSTLFAMVMKTNHHFEQISSTIKKYTSPELIDTFLAENGEGNYIEALVKNSQINELKFLFSIKNPDQIKNAQGQTAVHFAMKYGKANILFLLNQLKASLTLPDNEGNTPAHIAALHDNTTGLELLKRLNVPVEQHNKKGEKPSDILNKNVTLSFKQELIKLGAELIPPEEIASEADSQIGDITQFLRRALPNMPFDAYSLPKRNQSQLSGPDTFFASEIKPRDELKQQKEDTQMNTKAYN